MATDPRLDAATLGAGAGTPNAPVARLLAKIADLERRIAVLERAATVRAGAGPPPPNAVRDGTLYVDITNSRLYARSAATWKSAVIS